MPSMTVHRTFPVSVQPGIPRLGDPKRGWTRFQIGQLFEEVKRPANIQDNERYRLVTVRRARGGLAPRSKLLGKEVSVKSQFIIRAGDFLISKRQIVHGACAVVTEEFDGAIVSNEYSVLRCKNNLKLEYLEQLFHSVYVQQTFFHSSIGVHIEKMIFKLEDWFKWSINLPSLPEQQKTAAFLSSVDRRIAQLGQKKALLQRYKKGMMQKLFSQELRFKDAQGHDFPDWENTTIGNLGSFYYGKSAPKFSLSEDAPTPCVRYGELYSKYNVVISETISRTNIDPKNLKFSSGGEILVPRVGEDPMDFAKNCCFLPLKNVAIGEMISVFNTDQNSLFYTYYFRTLRKQFAKVVEGASVSNLYYSYLEPIEIGKPALPEQQKIADFLSSIDRKIDLVSTELDHAKAFKKGLLQQMFI